MNRRDALKTVAAGISALAIVSENAIAEPSQVDIEKVRQSLDSSPFAGQTDPRYVKRLSHADYDLLHVAAGQPVPSQSFLFSNPMGTMLPGACPDCGSHRYTSTTHKTILMTNMHRGNQFPPPQSRVVERIVFLFLPSVLKEDRDHFIAKSYWEFTLDDKIVGRAPLAWSPVEGELVDLIDFDGKFPKQFGRNERQLSPGQYVHLEKPVYIAPQQQFSLVIVTEQSEHEADLWCAKGDIDMYVLLDGSGEFSVQ